MTVAARRSGGDDRAFERMYRGHVREVFRYALALLGDPGDAEDVTQTTFLNAYRAYQRGERPSKPGHWLIAIAHNACRQRFRQARSRPSEVAFDEELDGAVVATDDETPTLAELRRAFLQLPPSQRSALAMRELEGRPNAEIADVLGISVSALETLLFRARRTLREQLEEQLTCREAAFAISKQLDGALDLGARLGLRAHLRRCPECARLARGLRAQRKALRGLLAVPLPRSLATFFARGSGLTAGASTAGGYGAAGLAVKIATLATAAAAIGGGAYIGSTHLARHRAPVPSSVSASEQQRTAIGPRVHVAAAPAAIRPVDPASRSEPGAAVSGQTGATSPPDTFTPPAVVVAGGADAADPSAAIDVQAAAGTPAAADGAKTKANGKQQHGPPSTPPGQSSGAGSAGTGGNGAAKANGKQQHGPPSTPPGQAKKAAAAAATTPAQTTAATTTTTTTTTATTPSTTTTTAAQTTATPPGQSKAQANANASAQGAAHGRAHP